MRCIGLSTTNKTSKAASDRRRYRRWNVSIPSRFKDKGGTHDCIICDLSPAGAGVEMASEQTLPVGTDVILQLEGFGAIPSETRHNGSERLGSAGRYPV